MAGNWSAHTSFSEVQRRAGGRSRYNDRRRVAAALRRIQVMELLQSETILTRGTQARLARAVGVSEATLSRDVKALLYSGSICRSCGHMLPGDYRLKPI